MRKRLFLIILAFFITSSIYSQNEVNRQYEIIPWKPVEKAKKYEIEIEIYDNQSLNWIPYTTEQTKETQIELLFTPGEYRARISTINILGRKKATSEWKQFKILEETVPYLFNNYYQKTAEWNAPVLFLNRTGLDVSIFPESEKFIKAPEGYSNDILFIKGKNIFSPDTEFYLIPQTDSKKGGKTYNAYNNSRKEQKLTLVKRDSILSGVYVSYKPENLGSGYYTLEARNPGNNRASIEILVIAEDSLEMNPVNLLEDKRYLVNYMEMTDSEMTVSLDAEGEGLSSAVSYMLEPTTGVYSYPFETTQNRQRIILEQNLVSCSKDTAQLKFDIPQNQLKTGYYLLKAKSYTGLEDDFLFLAKKTFDTNPPFNIKKITSKYNKRTQSIDLTLKVENFDYYADYVLISEYESDKDSNERIPLYFNKSSQSDKKMVASISVSKFYAGKQALMIESEDKCYIQYLEIDKRMKTQRLNLTPQKADEIFLRPENIDAEIVYSSEDTHSITFEDEDINYYIKRPPLFNRLNVVADVNMVTNNYKIKLDLDVINTGWFFFKFGTLFGPKVDELDNKSIDVYTLATTGFAINNENFSPYLSLSYGYGIYTKSNLFTTYISNDAHLQNSMIIQAGLGIKLFDFFDVGVFLSRGVTFADPLIPENFNIKDFDINIGIGAGLPLRSPVLTRKVISQSAVLHSNQTVDGKDFTNLGKKASIIRIDSGVTEIKGFENRTEIERIIIPESVVKIDKDTFAGWTSGQEIETEFDLHNSGDRNMDWVKNTKAMTSYEGDVYNLDRFSAFENSENYKLTVIETSSIYLQDNIFYNGIYYNAISLEIEPVAKYKLSTISLFNIYSPENLINEFKAGNKLCFKAKGDGKKYKLYIETKDLNAYEYEFKTLKGKVKQIEILYNNLKPVNKSTTNDFNKNDVMYINILPCGNYSVPELSLFDFQVE